MLPQWHTTAAACEGKVVWDLNLMVKALKQYLPTEPADGGCVESVCDEGKVCGEVNEHEYQTKRTP